MNEEKINIAVNILNNQIAKLTKELAIHYQILDWMQVLLLI